MLHMAYGGGVSSGFLSGFVSHTLLRDVLKGPRHGGAHRRQ